MKQEQTFFKGIGVTAATMSFEDYWQWLDNLKVGDEVVLYWTAGSFGHYKAKARLVRVNPKSVAGKLEEEVSDDSGLRPGEVAYPVGHVIVVPKSMLDRRHSAFFNAPMPIGVDRIAPGSRMSNERRAVMKDAATELMGVAKEIIAAGSKGTLEAYSNRDGGSITLRKLFGTASVGDLVGMASAVQAEFRSDVWEAVRYALPNKARVSEYEPEVGGFSQGAYLQVVVKVEGLGAEAWTLLETLEKKGYRVKR